MEFIDYLYHHDAEFHAIVRMTVIHELRDQAFIRKQVQREIREQTDGVHYEV